jgi:transcriptional regulator with XRE-family HTH domain
MSNADGSPEDAGTTSRLTVGERIKAGRARANLSQRALAQKLGVSAGAVAQWEVGVGLPATERLNALSEALNVSIDWLLGRHERASAATITTADDMMLVREARQLGVDLKQVVADARQRRWVDENRGAIEDANTFLTKDGLWSDGKRLF